MGSKEQPLPSRCVKVGHHLTAASGKSEKRTNQRGLAQGFHVTVYCHTGGLTNHWCSSCPQGRMLQPHMLPRSTATSITAALGTPGKKEEAW